MSFTSKVAIVTGAASGIGAATAQALAKEGANVTLVDKDKGKLKEVAKKCETFAKSLAILADVTKDADAKNIVKKTVDQFGQVNVLVNCAGIARYSSITDEGIMDNFDEVINTNLRSIVYLTHLAAPHLMKTKGNIVNISSVAAFRVFDTTCLSYSISKAGLNHFTRCVALDLAQHGVRVNAINPGPTRTDIALNSGIENPEEVYECWRTERTALQKIAEPEEIADLVVFLASDKAKSITGSMYVSDNGTLLK